MKYTLLSILIITVSFQGTAQEKTEKVKEYLKDEKVQVYHIRPWINGAIIVGGFVGNYFGVQKVKGKPGVTYDKVITLTPEDVNAFDRGAAKQDPAAAANAMKISDITLTTTVLLPALLAFDDKIKKDAVNVLVVYLTTMSIMSNAYSWGVGNMDKYRPYVYNPQEDMSRRLRNGSKNSFYAGHVAATACATFFIAKVYHDYNPGSRLTPYLFGVAVIPPAIVGYYRYKAGMHFPTDIIAGFAAGTAIGIAVPQLHKFKKKNLSFYPAPGGMGLTYQF